MAGSALLGGIAVALWSRKSLHRVRQSLDEGRAHPRNSNTDSDSDAHSDADSGFSEDQ